jgi:hypothetical protein
MQKEIHVGAKTHIHGQLILLVNLRTINTICKAPVKPMPPDELDVLEVMAM